MPADVLEKPVLVGTDTDSPDELAHYLRKRLHDAYVTGQPVEALCGYIWVPHRDPGKYPICPKCKEIYDNFKRD